MNAESLNLPEASQASFVQELQFHPEWRIDPAFLYRLDPRIAHQVVSVRFEYLSQVAELQSQALQGQAAMYKKMADVVREGG